MHCQHSRPTRVGCAPATPSEPLGFFWEETQRPGTLSGVSANKCIYTLSELCALQRTSALGWCCFFVGGPSPSCIQKGCKPEFRQVQPMKSYSPDIFEYVYFARLEAGFFGSRIHKPHQGGVHTQGGVYPQGGAHTQWWCVPPGRGVQTGLCVPPRRGIHTWVVCTPRVVCTPAVTRALWPSPGPTCRDGGHQGSFSTCFQQQHRADTERR